MSLTLPDRTAHPASSTWPLLVALSAVLVACAPVGRRSSIERTTTSSETGGDNTSACSVVVSRPRGGLTHIQLLNQPSLSGTSLGNAPAGQRMTAEDRSGGFIRVSFINDQGLHVGNTSQGQPPVYVIATDIACGETSALGVPPPAAISRTDGSKAASPSTAGVGQTSGSAPTPTQPAAGTPAGAAAGAKCGTGPVTAPTSTCRVKAPGWFGTNTPECKDSEGKTTASLKNRETVRIKTIREPGSPDRYCEVDRRCAILAERIDVSTCLPALRP